MEYITTKEASKKWGISTTRITILANEGRIPGAQRLGKSWLIPVIATKPPILTTRRSASSKKVPKHFCFPLFHFRPDWSYIKESELSKQQQSLLHAERAVLECRFTDAYPVLESILRSPEDIITEIGCLWNMGICCVALNKPKDFSRIFLRLQILLSDDFPHRDDLVIVLDILKTYIETMDVSADTYTYNPNIHDQSLPTTCVQMGYVGLIRESFKPRSTNISLLEINQRLLKTTGVIIATGYMHCHLLGIYYLRQNPEEVQIHAKAAVQIAFESGFFLHLVSYYRYYAQVFSSVLDQYPEEFREHCYNLFSQYEENFPAFLSSINEYTVFARLSNSDYPYAHGVFMNLTNDKIAKKLNVHPHTVNRRLKKICEKLGVKTKKELKDYLHKNM